LKSKAHLITDVRKRKKLDSSAMSFAFPNQGKFTRCNPNLEAEPSAKNQTVAPGKINARPAIGGFSAGIFFEFLTLPPCVFGRYLIEEARERNLDNENGRTRLLTG
jgi:hypothetical protein